MGCNPVNEIKEIGFWVSSRLGVVKLHVGGAVRGKPRSVCIGSILSQQQCEIFYMFSKHVGDCSFNKWKY